MSEAVSIAERIAGLDRAREGREMYELVTELYPLCRSITGEGLRESLRRLQRRVPLVLREVPSGTQVFDWTVPDEWNIREAWIKSPSGETIVDFKRCNLHVLNYSAPVRQKVGLAELRQHLFSLPDHPDWIPDRTSYYKRAWGFCVSDRQLQALGEGEYEVCIDSTLAPGSLTYGEWLVPGSTEEEFLISCHSCHPSLCNDNLAGMAVAAQLANHLRALPRRYSYRFLWAPGTIGAITWLAQNESRLKHVRAGLVLSCLGDAGGFTFKRTRAAEAPINRLVEHVLRHSGQPYAVEDFSPMGYDERQYCSPGINLAVGCLMRTPNGRYPQYHTSADDLTLVTPAALAESLRTLLSVVQALEANGIYLNLQPKCEPQLGRRGLYSQVGGTAGASSEKALLWVLNFSDGRHSLLDIAERSRLSIAELSLAAARLVSVELLRRMDDETHTGQ